MPRYTAYAKLVVEFESPRSAAQIRQRLVEQSPTLREALKAAWRAQFAKDPSGNTFPVSWHFHINQASGDAELDLDDGLPVDETEP